MSDIDDIVSAARSWAGQRHGSRAGCEHQVIARLELAEAGDRAARLELHVKRGEVGAQ